MEWGDKIEFLKGVYEQTGQTPKALLNRPSLSQFEQPYYEAFQKLSSSRAWTMAGPAPIPFSEIVTYLKFEGITDKDEQDEYVAMIREIDTAFLDHANKKK